MLNLDNSSGKFFAQTDRNENTEFLSRQKSVFEKLDAVVKDSEKNLERQNKFKRPASTEETRTHKKLRHDTRQFRGQESIFKRPEAPPPARFKNNTPDYQRHPQKWTKYTLSDVSQEDMSDKSNTAAAMSFLRELQAKKEMESMDVDSEVKQITFKKPTKHVEAMVDNSAKYESPSFRSSKVVMPEYVVGEKKTSKRSTAKPSEKTDKSKEIKLDHLNEEDDE
uniref:U5 small nuclear ribonucleoprotein TSSC4 n=1 Tax=Graphocephala atropunctata TaxID=36148 RepID=A0A1B6LUD1_9HEMI